LIIKIKQNLTFIKNGKILNSSKFSQVNCKKDKISYEYSNNFNQENIFLMSQTYLFHKIWQTGIINKCNFKSLLKNWTSNLIIRKTIKKKLKKKGIFSLIELKYLKEKNWKQWLQIFNKYNISSQVWYKIAPQEWRNQVSHQWKNKRKRKYRISEKQNQTLILSKQKKFSYKLVTNFLLKQNKNLNKRYQYNYLCYSYLDSKKNLDFIPLINNNEENLFNNKFSQILKNNNNNNKFIKSN